MIPLEEIYNEIIEEFTQALKERRGVDSNFIDSDMIKRVNHELRNNLQEKEDLFNKLRFQQTFKMPTHQNSDSSSSESKQSSQDEQKEQSKSVSEDGEQSERSQNEQKRQSKQKPPTQKQLKQQKKREEISLQKDYQKEKSLIDKVRKQSKKSASLHISAFYNLKTRKYISAKSQEQVNMPMLIIKSQTDQQIFTDIQGKFSKGDKNKALKLCQSEGKKEQKTKKEETENEKKQSSYEQRMAMLKQMLKK